MDDPHPSGTRKMSLNKGMCDCAYESLGCERIEVYLSEERTGLMWVS